MSMEEFALMNSHKLKNVRTELFILEIDLLVLVI